MLCTTYEFLESLARAFQIISTSKNCNHIAKDFLTEKGFETFNCSLFFGWETRSSRKNHKYCMNAILCQIYTPNNLFTGGLWFIRTIKQSYKCKPWYYQEQKKTLVEWISIIDNISLPGVSMTFTIRPSFNIVLCNSQVLVTPEKLSLDKNASLPRILLPVALFPLPVFPKRTKVLTVLTELVKSQSASMLPLLIVQHENLKLPRTEKENENQLPKVQCLYGLRPASQNTILIIAQKKTSKSQITRGEKIQRSKLLIN